MLAVAYKKDNESGTFYRSPLAEDYHVFLAAKEAMSKSEAEHEDPFFPLIPDEPSPGRGSLSIRLAPYGIKQWGQIYNVRQLLTLTTFVDAIYDANRAMLYQGATDEMGQAVSLYLAFALIEKSFKHHTNREVIILLKQ